MVDLEAERRFIRKLAGRALIKHTRWQMFHEIRAAAATAIGRRNAANSERNLRRKRERAYLLDRHRRQRGTTQLMALRGQA